ncbi:major facilitator superfamily domain-containing protein [Spinellus fusiger]|nr:major facilitator superfamily domain-containing protein [Spinellus fusiger]
MEEKFDYENSPEEREYLRKLNWTLLPLLGFIIFIQFSDKTLLSTSAVMGLLEDVQLTGNQFGWLGSIFYLGYLIFQPPNNYLLQKVKHSRYLGILITVWGAVMVLTAFCQSFHELAAARFFLGLLEAGTNPCLYIILSRLYRRSEQSACFCFTSFCTGFGTVIGIGITIGISTLNGRYGLHAWRWGYIIYGIITMVLGIVVFFLLVDNPYSKLLRITEKQKLIVEDRIRDNAVVKNKVIKRNQIWEALNEPRLWLLSVAMFCCYLQNSALITFSTLLVRGLGFSSPQSILLQIPSGAAALFFSLFSIWLSRKTNQMIYISITMITISMIGCTILVAIPEGPLKLFGYYLNWAASGGTSLILAIVSNNVSGYTKKICYNGVIMVFYTLGNFIGPLMMVDRQSPRYIGGISGFIGANALAIVCLMIVRLIMSQENKKRLANQSGEATDVYLDKTDKEDTNFLYRL